MRAAAVLPHKETSADRRKDEMGAGLVYSMAWLESAEDPEAPVKVRMHGKYSDRCFVVSKCDVERVLKHRWSMWNYPHCREIGNLHHLVIGARPAHIPPEWVVDHANGDIMDARLSNLRWVTPKFNAWNTKINDKASSKYRGVSPYFDKWRANSLHQHLGIFVDEREAGMACAKHAIAEFREWAMTSHVLLKNFTPAEIARMKDEIDAGESVHKSTKTLPMGITYSKSYQKYIVRCAGVYVGSYDTVDEAVKSLERYREEKLRTQWETHKRTKILRDPTDGAAVIALSGDVGIGLYAKVPEELWHELTFQTSWHISRGYASTTKNRRTVALHVVVWSKLNPGYKAIKGFSIDHIKPELILDNRAQNLRLASYSNQARNKRSRGTSKYPGISFDKVRNKFVGSVSVDGKRHQVRADTELEAVKALNALRVRLLGPDTPLLKIIE
jgi:HNH endonuclease